MKPFKTYASIALSFSALLFAASCNKTLDEKESGDVSRLDAHEAFIPCGIAIELQTKQGTATGNFFWIGDKSDMAGRQNFNGTTFTENNYFDVTSNVGMPFHKQQNGAIGVVNAADPNDRDYSIDAGEQLWFTLSSNLSEFKMSGFQIILHGAAGSTGSIELYDGGEWVKTIAIAPTTPQSQNFGVEFQSNQNLNPAEFEFFTQVRFVGLTGRFHILGFQGNKNPNLLKPGKFFLANVNDAIYMRNQASNAGGAFGFTNTYINRGFYPGGETTVVGYQNNRQYKRQVADNSLNSGEYDQTNDDKWLKISSTGGTLLYEQFRLGVSGTSGMTLGQSIIIEPGNDFPTSHFGAFEFREAVIPSLSGGNDSLRVVLYDGMDIVGMGTTSGIDQTYNIFYGSRPFDKIVISGIKVGSSGSTIGRPSNQVMSAYPACN